MTAKFDSDSQGWVTANILVCALKLAVRAFMNLGFCMGPGLTTFCPQSCRNVIANKLNEYWW